MGILFDLGWALVHLCCVAADVGILLLLCRIVARGSGISWVQRIDERARDIVDAATVAIGRFWYRVARLPIPQQYLLAASLLTLCLARLVVLVLTGLIRM